VPPKKKSKVAPAITEVTFSPEDEQRVSTILALVAAENDTGQMTLTRLAGLRQQMRLKLDALGEPLWRFGVDTAISHGKPWQYALGVFRRHKDGPPPPSRGSPAPRPRYEYEIASAGKFAGIGKRDAIRPGTDSLDRNPHADRADPVRADA